MHARPRSLAVIAMMSLPALVVAQSTATPPAASSGADNAPAAASAPAPTAAKVLVLPLTGISEGTDRDWIGRAMHQSMLAELARMGFVEPITPKASTEPVSTSEAAAQAGRDAGAAYVVYGSYQTIENDVRVTGQIVDASTGKIVGGIKATGNVRDLFGIEDIIANQLKRELAGAILPESLDPGVASSAAGAPATQPTTPAVAPSGPVALAPGTGFEGSELEEALREQTTAEERLDDAYDKYRYGDRTPPYYPDYGYRSPYGYDYYPRRIVVVTPGTGGDGRVVPGKTGAGEPAPLPPNGNYNTAPSGGKDNRSIGGNYNKSPYTHQNQGPRGGVVNTAPSGGVNRGQSGGNTVTGGSGNTVTGGSGNTATGSSGNSNAGGAGSNSK